MVVNFALLFFSRDSSTLTNPFVFSGESVRDGDRVPAERLHPGTAHVHGVCGPELAPADPLPSGHQGGNQTQSCSTGQCVCVV